VQEIAFAFATAIDVLDAVKASGRVPEGELPTVVERISFFLNSGIRFVEEICKVRAMTEMWDRITLERYGVTDPKARRFRYGVQVNSLGLTEAQPENNVPRIVLETLGATMSKRARARAVQLPAWNEALGLPRPWDQQWSLRIQQVLALETDLLEYDDLFDGSVVVERKTAELAAAAQAELDRILAAGGAFANIDQLKGELVQSHADRMRRIESGDISIVGVNTYTESAPSPLLEQLEGEASFLVVDPAAEREQVEATQAWRSARDAAAVAAAVDALRLAAESPDAELMEPTIALARAGGTVGEWAGVLRSVFGEYRAPTGIGRVAAASSDGLLAVRERIRVATAAGRSPIRILVGKPGLDGHSNGAEQIAVAARDAGMEVIYQGIRLTPAEIAAAARDEDVDVVGLSILSGSHLDLVPEVIRLLRAEDVEAPVIVGGIIPEADRACLLAAGASAVYTPKDYRLAQIMSDIADLVLGDAQAGPPPGR
jgi:(2R)-ethylmalonyl-CoA mutase